MSYESLIDPEVSCLLVMAKAWSESQHRMSLSRVKRVVSHPSDQPCCAVTGTEGTKGCWSHAAGDTHTISKATPRHMTQSLSVIWSPEMPCSTQCAF